ncbi:MAG TPA: LuxR C-terminal-related transcriptional regulator, partial [Rhodocyclaceae bacterium]|nr:LuxR C-terminal-related transcriptional regulator [Rhodocyclaceae bacterium]
VAATVAEALISKNAGDSSPAVQLSSRERQVLQLIAEGHTSAQIGDRLHVASATVDVHRRNIMRKLNLHSIAELTRFAMRNGITTN